MAGVWDALDRAVDAEVADAGHGVELWHRDGLTCFGRTDLDEAGRPVAVVTVAGAPTGMLVYSVPGLSLGDLRAEAA